MNVYRIYLFIGWFDFTPLLTSVSDKKGEHCFVFILTPLLMIDKKGEKDFEFIYACLCFCIYWVLCISCFRKQKGREGFWKKDFWIYAFVSYLIDAYIYLFSFMCFIEYLTFYCYAWVKGELLWSFTLIHAYITSWVLSSSKRGRLLAQRPITLVLMMINSWSYDY